MKLLKRILFIAVLLMTIAAQAQEEALHIRIGIQRGSLWNVPELYDQLVEALNEGLGREVTVELLLFPSGPPLLEAFNSDSIDIGATGDSPPIFAQAAGVPLVYVASQLSTAGSGILVPEASDIQTAADLKGKKVAFTRGSSANFFIIQALRAHGLDFGDIEPVYLQPGEARAAFDGGSVDAWVIWDPFLTIALNSTEARSILDSSEVPPSRSYHLASQKFAEEHPDALQIILEQNQATIDWTRDNLEDYAAFMEEQTELPADIWLQIREERELADLEYLSEDIIAAQQEVADVYAELGLIPEPIDVNAAVWVPEKIDIAEGGFVVEREEEEGSN